MSELHIVQSSKEDAIELDELKSDRRETVGWIVPKSAEVGDDVLVYLHGSGFIANATVATGPALDSDGKYRADLGDVVLIRPSISLETIREMMPDLKWANYPRGMKTAGVAFADRLRALTRRLSESSVRTSRSRPGVDSEIEDDIRAASSELVVLDQTTREAVIEARRGQGAFRQALLNAWQSCAVTGCDLPQVLRASHIKPWRYSSNAERLDPYNGLLLLGTLDLLFDAALISFLDSGELLISGDLTATQRKSLGLQDGLRLRTVDAKHVPCLSWHRERIFGAT